MPVTPDIVEFIYLPSARQRSRYIDRMAGVYDNCGDLTAAQVAAIRNIRAEMNGTTPPSPEAATALATTDSQVPNGVFTFTSDTGDTYDFMIYTVTRGSLQGKRIVKHRMGGTVGEFKGFAFVTQANDIKVWRSYYEQEAAEEPWILAAKSMVKRLAESALDPTRSPATDHIVLLEVQVDDAFISGSVEGQVSCRVCNRTGQHLRQTSGAHPSCCLPDVNDDDDDEDDEPFTSRNSRSSADRLIEANPAVQRSDILAGAVSVAAAQADLRRQLAEMIVRMETSNSYDVRPCDYCGSDRFLTVSGRGRHRSACRRNHNNLTVVERIEALLQANIAEHGDTGVAASAPGGIYQGIPSRRRGPGLPVEAPQPNLSQLGTVVNGTIWEQ